MDVYRSLAAIINSSAAASTDPITLIASQLSGAAPAQKPELSRILAELLRSQSTPDAAAQKTLHDYIRSLVSSVNADDASQDFKLAVELADEGLLLQILGETVKMLEGLLVHAKAMHVSSDDAFAVLFDVFFEKHVEFSGEALEQDGLRDAVVSRLRFWHFLFMIEGARDQAAHQELFQRFAQALPARLLGAMALRDDVVAKAASNVLCCFVNDFHQSLPAGASEMLWDGISRLITAGVHVDLALALWLRWIAATSENVKPTQKILGQDRYWELIKECLATGFSERRKYSLHLLMTSISLTQEPVNTRTFSFDPKKRGPIIAAWTKFTTLIEITSLSTSPNQLRDATPDLRRLLDPTSPVPASWIIVLIALGFSSGSGGVSRVFWDFLASLENRRIARLFEGPEGRALLQDVIIPFAATASSFVVLRPTPDKCEHGTELAKWIGTILNAGDAEMRKQCGRAIMAWIDAKEDNVFVPARAWILKGLLDGVQGQTVFDAPEDLATFVRIGKMRRFTKMKVDVCVAIVLKLLLSVDAAKIGFAEFWDALAEVALKKEYLLSEEYVLALHERFGQALVGGGELQHLGRMTFVEEGESEPPSRKELLKAVLVMCCMSCWIRGFQVDIDTQMPRLSFWTVLHGNQQLFRCVARLFDGQAILPSILKAHADPTSDDGDLADLLQLWPVEAAEKGILGAMLKSRWAKLQEARGKKFEQGVEKQRANWAVICASCTRLLGECTLTVEETIVMVNSFDLPVLGRNKHDNIEMTATAGRFIGAMLRVLETAILESKAELDTKTTFKVLLALPRLMRFLENESLLRALGVVKAVATTSPKQLQESQKLAGSTQLDSLILQLWETVDASTLRSDFVKAYHGFIDLIFHPFIIYDAVENDGLRDAISTVAAEILKLGNGKRSIKPAIARGIRAAFMATPEHPAIIGQSTWLLDIIFDLINYSQSLRDIDLVVEQPVTMLFDEVSPSEEEHYKTYYGDREIFAQVYMFDMLTRMDEKQPALMAFVKRLREMMFAPWTENFSGMSIWVSWKKHTYLQTLILLERFVENSDEAKEFLFRVINDALAHEPHPRFRFLFEWIVALCLLRFPGNRDCVWEYLQFPAHQNPKLQVSLLRISLMVARNLPASIREPYFTELAYTVVPLTSNTKVVVRHQSIAMILELWEDADRLGFTTLTENPIFSGVHRGVVTSPYYKEFKGQKDFSTFDPVGNLTFRGIFNGGYLSGGDEVEVIPVDAFHHVSVSAPGRESTLQLGASPSPAPSTSAPIPAPETPPTPDHTGRVEYKKFDLLNLAAGAALPAPIQTKGSSTSPTASTETDIIVCASLLDNAINLGGVSRVSEIMGVKTLTLHARAAVLKSPEFLGVSVHSENWLDIQEVPIAGIAAYLRKMRAEGYAAVGIEQTDRSVILGDEVACRFPKKTLLLLGTEKFGIPAELLGELDWCVEIPQKGRTRSMNVQTAAAVVLYDVVRGAGRAVERV